MAVKRLNKPDTLFIAAIFFLVLLGLVVLSSASAPVAIAKFNDAYFYVKRQILLGLLPGLFLFFVLLKLDYRLLKKMMWMIYAAAVALLLLVFIPGIGTSFNTGAQSWIAFAGFSLQPSEIVKLLFVIFSAAWLERLGPGVITDVKRGLLPFLGLVAVPMLLIVLQPDIGTLAIFATVLFVLLFLAGARWLHLAVLAGTGVAGFLSLIAIAPYRAARFMTFLHPELDPQGIGYHINQAFLAIGSGGLLGVGFGHSRQKFQYLPEVIADSIFAVYAEELGFLFAAGLIVFWVWLVARAFKIARGSLDQFGALLVYGSITWLSFQSFFNIAAMVGLLPLTGVPLPLMSHGGTALMTALAGAGIIASVSRHAKR